MTQVASTTGTNSESSVKDDGQLKGIQLLISEFRWLGRVFLSSSDRFYWDNGFSKAASLAYTTLLSLVPLTALCFGILATFIQGHVEVQEFIFRQFIPGSTLTNLMPYFQQFTDNVRTLNFVVIISLAITSLLLINSVEAALNQVWQVYEARPLTDRIAIFCAILIIGPVLIVSGYYTTTKVEPIVADIDMLNRLYHDSLPFLIDFIAFTALYFLVPKAPVKFIAASFGALVASLLFGWAKNWFALYIAEFSSYLTVYGTIASSIPIFLFWLYISWTIVLFGAEISYQAQNLPKAGKLWKRSVMTVGDGAMVLAIQALVMVVRAFEKGLPPPNEIEVAARLGCSSVVLKPSLDALEQANILMRGGGRTLPLLLLRDPQKINLAEIRDALFKKRECLQFGGELSKSFIAFSKEQDPYKISLADVVREQA